MLGRRLRRRPNIKTTLDDRLVIDGTYIIAMSMIPMIRHTAV